ncbi:hypothetical protein Curi_c28100 [Gottschalkia acidurici 9a]|uniref:DUF4179 domain-containing protein n=1 Tax=Gottschalkia acidurici (strain ATCC 7906 / DSM 604 / BCRC 14475 / CIP 104303 / KCTC 5404 / NCIMB 10678 / 9a) TaxID=1128398 RepID=K0B1B8_GOTA9|nr:hypothetical protein [Gottschalkia acidurici]AFS79803.1 hypothetical protein Curi_c28100 [Gottschalkia acidurici 9a]
MKNSEQLDQLLKNALSSTVEPSEDLNQKIINQLKENNVMKSSYRKKVAAALVAVSVTLTVSITGVAAWNLLNPKQVAEHIGDQTLAQAFKNKNAIEINESVVSGEYNFTFLGIVSGKGLSSFKTSGDEIHPDRTYAVVAIAKKDGEKMPDSQDEKYGEVPFFVSPLIKGQKPWQFNIASMNGGYSEFVNDGVMYRLIECDGVEMFADRGLYLAVSTSNFYDVNAFNYSEETGEITVNPNYNGANALFNLPIDVKKANNDKAEKYIKELLEKTAKDSKSSMETDIDIEEEIKGGVVIPESVQKVTYDKDGLAHYEYEGHKISISVDDYFKEGEINVYKTVSISGDDKRRRAAQFSKDANGVITGRLLELKP